MKNHGSLFPVAFGFLLAFASEITLCQAKVSEQDEQPVHTKLGVLAFKAGRVILAESNVGVAVDEPLSIISGVHISTSSGTLLYGSIGGGFAAARLAVEEETNVVKEREEKTTAEKETELKLPTEYALFQNYPNPFNPSTLIQFDIPEVSRVRLVTYDVLGREVATLIDRELEAATYRWTWEGRDRDGKYVASGVYFYRLDAASLRSNRALTSVKKLLILR